MLRHVEQRGFHAIPLPITTRDGNTFVQCGGPLWELTPWLSGRADYFLLLKPEKLAAAMVALAHWHLAASDFSRQPATKVTPPGVVARLRQTDELLGGGWQRLAAAVAASRNSAADVLPRLAEPILDRFPTLAPAVRSGLAASAGLAVPLQPCIRDIWHNHVLFDGDRVTGLVDFGSMRMETVAGDVARLLGSMVDHGGEAWRQGLAAYQTVRPLSPEELSLIDVLHSSGVLLSGMNWIQWLFVEGRRFDDMAAVAERLRWIAGQFEFTL